MNAQVSGLLEQIRSQLIAEQGEGEALPMSPKNDIDVADAYDMFMSEVLEALLTDFEATDEDALDFMMDVADEMAAAGTLPASPDEDSSDEEIAAWLGVAKTAGYQQAVLDAAEESAEDEE